MRTSLLLLLALAASPALAQSADLMSVYRDAQSSDPVFSAARYALDAGREKLPQARAGLLPQISLSANSGYYNVDASKPTSREYGYNSNGYSLNLTQPLFRWQNVVALRQGALQGELAEAQFSVAKMDLMQRVTQAYFDLLYAQDALFAVQQLRAAASEQLGLAKKSFEVGTVTVTDVNDAQSRHDIASAQEIAATNDVNIKREALRVLTGKEPPELARLRSGVMLAAPAPADANAWAQAALQGNLGVASQQINREIAARNVEAARAGHLPTVDAVASIGRSHATNGNSGQPSEGRNWMVGVQATLPLFQGGGTQSKVREAVALESRAVDDLESARRNAGQLARQSYLGVTSGIAQVAGYEAAVRSSLSALDSNKLGYEVGVKINKDVLDAQSQLATTRQQLAQARYNTLIAQVRLKQAVGTLSEQDLLEINGLLEH